MANSEVQIDNISGGESAHTDLGSIHILGREIAIQPSYVGIGVEILIILLFILLIKKFRLSKVATLFDAVFEGMFDFFESILGVAEKYRIKAFVVGIFFVIVFSNLLGILLEIIIPMFGKDAAGEYILHHYIQIPSSDINFNVAMSVVSILIMLFVQMSHGVHMKLSKHDAHKLKYGIAGGIYLTAIWILIGHFAGMLHTVRVVGGVLLGMGIGIGATMTGLFGDRILGFIHFIHDYISITGKDILTIERSAIQNPLLYRPVRAVIKLFDIAISVFIGGLEIVGLIAKIISLSYRLFGNMIAGGILLGILFLALGEATQELLGGREMPVIAPIIIYLQEILIALIQALVFPLLVAIFIRVAQSTE